MTFWARITSILRDQRGVFTLDNPTLGVLGGNLATYNETIIADRGRSIQVDWSQAGLDQDIEIYGYSIRYSPAEVIPRDV